ncbi:MAG: hypothetical protein EPN97_01690 [Alphaproteobacteria bacterium]|nr:MAG: hypothetical protein EPN97_01690 [Alphaproteobacteria bacterium]
MGLDIHSVSLEQRELTLNDFAKAAKAALRGRFREAKSCLSGESKLVARDANGNPVFAISGGREMSIVTKHSAPAKPDPAPPETPSPPVISDEALVLQQPMTVRRNPLSLKKS